MAKYRGTPEREVSAIAGRAILSLDPRDLPLMERLLSDYARNLYMGGKGARDMRGYFMRHDEARNLALKIRRLRRGPQDC